MTGFVDQAFKLIKAEEPGFFIWRIEQMAVRLVPREHHGSFFDGDSYIVYSASTNQQRKAEAMDDSKPSEEAESSGGNGQKKTIKGGKLAMHIHFWLGEESSVDEIATAAKKAVELDDYLGGFPTQHREVQGFESARFKAYFKAGIRVLKGGVASGLRHVTQDFSSRLFRVKGKRSPVLTEQASVSWQHFNAGDCFILETMSRIFVWVGFEANKNEKLQAAKCAMQLRDERAERTIVFVDEAKEEELFPGDLEEFFKHLPLAERSVKPAEPDSDAAAETLRSVIKLYRCTDEDGSCKIIHQNDGPLNQEQLKSDDSFIVDNASYGIWVWVGRRATTDERKQAMSHAQDFVVKKKYPTGTQVTRVIDGAEPTEFKMLFTDWRDVQTTLKWERQYSLSNIAPTVNTKFDAKVLHRTPALAADLQLVDDGTGQLTVWRLHGKELEPVPQEQFGVFFDGDCYLLHYAYNVNNKTNYILYYWLGAHSAQDERGTIAWHTVQKDEELAGKAVQVRVVQGKEPPHFLTIFKGKMVVFNGGYASSFDGVNGHDVGIPEEFLIQVRGGDNHNTRAVQVERRATALNSNDVFVLPAGPVTYVWCGKGSTGDERERAKAIAAQWAPRGELVVVSEGQRNDEDFWKVFPNGKEAYANDERLRDSQLRVPARLFQCSNATGVFKAEEIRDFAQSDLVQDDIMVLDSGSAIFIWIGVGANKEERLSVFQLVHDYLSSDPRGRDVDTPTIQIQQGHEPPNFTGFFGTWDPTIWENDDFDKVRTELEGVRIVNIPELIKEAKHAPTYSVDVLRQTDADKLPDDVNALRKEAHLTDDDFQAIFGMEREDFAGLPEWRRNELKKKVLLF